MTTTIYKAAHGGWAAESTHHLAPGRQLFMLTMKRSSGELVTTARTERSDAPGVSTFQPYGTGADLSLIVCRSNRRATQHAAAEQHAAALESLGDLTAQAIAHIRKVEQFEG